MFECLYTQEKGTASCRGCLFNYFSEHDDGVCLLPRSAHERAAVGLEPAEPFNLLMLEAIKNAERLDHSRKDKQIRA